MLRHKNFNPTYHESSVTATYEAAFRKLEDEEPDAAQLFSLLSFFDPENVSTDILTDNANEVGIDNPLLQVLKYSLNFERSISQLRQFSVQRLTRSSGEPRAIWIHDLVQEIYRDRMPSKNKFECLELALTLLHSCFPEDLLEMSDPGTWRNYEKCLPHVVAGIKHAEKLDAHSVRFARLCRDAGWFLYHKGQYNRAIEMTTMSLPLIEQHYGKEDDEYVSAINLLAAANHTKGNHALALKWYFKVLDFREKKYGRRDDATTNTLHNIALVFHEAGDFEESERRFEEVVTNWKTKYGSDHRSTLCSQMSAARNYRYQGKYQVSEEMLQMSHAGLVRDCGTNHIWSLLSLSELASTIWRRDDGRFEQAEGLHRAALAEKIKSLGEDHVHTWDSYGDLGHMIWRCDPSRADEAEEMILRALRPYVETLTIDHPQTREFYDYLVDIYRVENQPEKLDALRTTFGVPSDHPPLSRTIEHREAVDIHSVIEETDSVRPHGITQQCEDKTALSELILPSVKYLPEPARILEERVAVPVSLAFPVFLLLDCNH
jgi:tetratricopeptide (TPR) repeat protein